jgi:hypothetical protein
VPALGYHTGEQGKQSGEEEIGSEESNGAALKGAKLSIAERHDWFPFLKDKITLHKVARYVKLA